MALTTVQVLRMEFAQEDARELQEVVPSQAADDHMDQVVDAPMQEAGVPSQAQVELPTGAAVVLHPSLVQMAVCLRCFLVAYLDCHLPQLPAVSFLPRHLPRLPAVLQVVEGTQVEDPQDNQEEDPIQEVAVPIREAEAHIQEEDHIQVEVRSQVVDRIQEAAHIQVAAVPSQEVEGHLDDREVAIQAGPVYDWMESVSFLLFLWIVTA
jgi:hypothetical protein